MSARLCAAAWICTRWPGTAGKLGVSVMTTVGGAGDRASRIRTVSLVTSSPSLTEKGMR